MSRSRSARHRRTTKAEPRLNKGSETRSGSVKNYDYETHLSKKAEPHFLKTRADEQSGRAPDSISRQAHIPSFFNDNCYDDDDDYVDDYNI